jgi:hypothetical protein
MFAKTEFTEKSRFIQPEKTEPWLAEKQPADADPEKDDLAADLDDDLEDDELDDDELDDDEDLDDDDDELDDLTELDDEYDKAEEEKQRPAHPGKYDD